MINIRSGFFLVGEETADRKKLFITTSRYVRCIERVRERGRGGGGREEGDKRRDNLTIRVSYFL